MLASGTEIVCALDRGELLVGRSHECDHPAWVRRLPAVSAPRFLTSLPSEAIDARVRALAHAGEAIYDVDAARLAALRPDLVITQTQCDVCAVNLRDVEVALGAQLPGAPQVLALHPDSLAAISRDIRRIADALGVPERGVQLITRMRTRLRSIGERAGTMPRRRVVCLEWLAPLMVAGHWTPELLALAGGDDPLSVAGAATTQVTLEQIAAADPDAIVIAPCGFDLARTRLELEPLANDPRWLDLRAVREGAVILSDGNAYFSRPGPRVVDTLEILAEAFHPAAFRFGHEGRGFERLEPGGLLVRRGTKRAVA